MLGINYESSDEEEDVASTNVHIDLITISNPDPPAPKAPTPPISIPVEAKVDDVQPGPVSGPAQGPAVPATPTAKEQYEDMAGDAPPGSPYTMARTLIQNLTLPTVPNFDIPPSPPGSPPQPATKTFQQFLDFKKKGQHFNQRLEASSVLRDPGHLRRMMKFAGVSEEDMYKSTLGEGVGVPTVWPKEAYVEELRRAQKDLAKMKDGEKSRGGREKVEFVGETKLDVGSGVRAHAGKAKRRELEQRPR